MSCSPSARAPRVLANLGLLMALGCGQSETEPVGEPRARSGDAASATAEDAGGRQSEAGARSAGGKSAVPTSASRPDDRGDSLVMQTLDECGAENPAGLAPAAVEALKRGGDAARMRVLYPYDGTVFPRGLAPPLIMWDGAQADAAYVRIRSEYFTYDGCLKPSGPGRLPIPEKAWETAGAQTLGASTPFEVSLTTVQAGKVTGPIALTLIIAPARLSGSIYYNSYNSGGGGLLPSPIGVPGGGRGNDPVGALTAGGTISRIRPGDEQPETFLRIGACTGCHTVSANGERMVAKEIGSLSDGQIYALTTDTKPNPAPRRGGVGTAFVGLSPDGAVYVSTSVQLGVGPSTNGALPGIPAPATMYETDSGRVVQNSGVPQTAMMPTFAPSGDLLTFGEFELGKGSTLSLMRFDAKQRVASDRREVWRAPGGAYAGWPFVLPDEKALLFALGESPNFSGNGVGIIPLLRGPQSDLMIVDVESGKATILARAMGFDTPEDADAGKTYLPFGADELHQSYYPTVSPVASGGYFWVFFDSVRHYGNLGLRRQLWGAAIQIQREGGEIAKSGGLYALDPSSPAFYVAGQQLSTANHRAFTALDPCRKDGDECESGVDCCSGFCNDGVCGPKRGCAKEGEACATQADCCDDQAAQCIAGFCGNVVI